MLSETKHLWLSRYCAAKIVQSEILRFAQNDKHPKAKMAVLLLGDCSRLSLVQFNVGGEPLEIRRQSCNLLFLLREL